MGRSSRLAMKKKWDAMEAFCLGFSGFKQEKKKPTSTSFKAVTNHSQIRIIKKNVCSKFNKGEPWT